MKSPLTGIEMKLMSEPSTLNYKGKTFNVIHYYTKKRVDFCILLFI